MNTRTTVASAKQIWIKRVFYADETGLCYKLLPDKSIVVKAETENGIKKQN